MKIEMKPHPLSLVIPDMTPDEFSSLTESIRTEGQLEDIVTLDGMILDGRHRYQVCQNLNLPCVSREYSYEIDGDSPTAFVMAKNVWRRHLSVSQRATIAAEIQPFYQEEAEKARARRAEKAAAKTPETPEPDAGEIPSFTAPVQTSYEQAAAAVGVSASSVERAVALKKEDPNAFADVRAGKKTLDKARKETKAKKEKAPKDPDKVESLEVRKENFLKLSEAHGQEFADAVLAGTLLPKKGDLEDFLTLDAETQQNLRHLIVDRWTTKKAVAFQANDLGSSATLQDLVLKYLTAGTKKFTMQLGVYQISVTKKE